MILQSDPKKSIKDLNRNGVYREEDAEKTGAKSDADKNAKKAEEEK